MNAFFLKSSCYIAITISLHAAAIAQPAPAPAAPVPMAAPVSPYDKLPGDLIIKSGGDKDVKIVLEIKDGKYLIDGKPVDEYNGDGLTILHDHRMMDEERAMDLDKDRAEIERAHIEMMNANSPFRKSQFQRSMTMVGNGAFLGVAAEGNEKGGVRIIEVTKGSAAEKAGLLKGDIIAKIDDHMIENSEMLTKVVREYKPETKVRVFIKRNGKDQTINATLGTLKEHIEKIEFHHNPEMSPDLVNLMETLKGQGAAMPTWFRDYGSPKIGIKAQDTEDGKGVKVIGVDDESNAAKAGVKEGDIITSFDGNPVNSAFELMDQAKLAKTKTAVKIAVTRNGLSQEMDLKIPHILKTADL